MHSVIADTVFVSALDVSRRCALQIYLLTYLLNRGLEILGSPRSRKEVLLVLPMRVLLRAGRPIMSPNQPCECTEGITWPMQSTEFVPSVRC